ncbi:uncharacterized protein LOC113335890 [Papaver somniferum]|uniref:uncharacterized protein LOC113335890 n=1 Tax=Papaver somniferum TaxID=3469 RepID=UPI000E6FCF35|nr:uncharacterized protein LOC113335890 [Papaver somniferum]
MDSSERFPSVVNCELRILRAKNLDFLTNGAVFVRYFIQNENNERIQLNTREIPVTPMCDPYWNASVSLECSGDKDVIDKLSRQSIVFELRWRNTKSVFGSITGSKLLGITEVSWASILESTELSIEKWVTTIPESRLFDGLKPASLQIGMKVTMPNIDDTLKRKNQIRPSSKNWKECGCKHGGCTDRDEDVFAVAATLDAF